MLCTEWNLGGYLWVGICLQLGSLSVKPNQYGVKQQRRLMYRAGWRTEEFSQSSNKPAFPLSVSGVHLANGWCKLEYIYRADAPTSVRSKRWVKVSFLFSLLLSPTQLILPTSSPPSLLQCSPLERCSESLTPHAPRVWFLLAVWNGASACILPRFRSR